MQAIHERLHSLELRLPTSEVGGGVGGMARVLGKVVLGQQSHLHQQVGYLERSGFGGAGWWGLTQALKAPNTPQQVMLADTDNMVCGVR